MVQLFRYQQKFTVFQVVNERDIRLHTIFAVILFDITLGSDFSIKMYVALSHNLLQSFFNLILSQAFC